MRPEDIKSIPPLIVQYQDLLVCPACGGELSLIGNKFLCQTHGHEYHCEYGIPLLFEPNDPSFQLDVTDSIKAFYEKNPFPSYDDIDSPQSLRERARQGIFARLLDEQIPPDAKILEVGCGTGQLSNFLGLSWQRTVFAVDISVNALKLGQGFKEKNQIGNTVFLQMNLFRPVFRADSFAVVICNGVLHHTSNPFLGLQAIAKLVKKGGFIVLGLYNKYGRIPTYIKRCIFKLSGNRSQFIDSRLRDKGLGPAKKRIWFVDQYKNPHESAHTMGEVLRWFDQTGFEFINGMPKLNVLETFTPDEKIFKSHDRGTALAHLLVQLRLLLSGREGGFFIMIGRKKL